MATQGFLLLIGIMEYWNDGLTGRKTRMLSLLFSMLSIPTFPLFHHSIGVG
jgi:hypothetical protein